MQSRFLFKNILISILLLFLFVLTFSSGCSSRDETAAVVIEGNAVKGRVIFTLDELKTMEQGLLEADYFCLNSYGTRQYFHFKGIWIGYLLQEKINLKDKASRVTFTADDGYEVEYTLADVLKEDYVDEQNPGARYKMILAWEEDGREYDPRKGSPFRLVVGQKEPGDVNKPYWVQYVKRICID